MQNLDRLHPEVLDAIEHPLARSQQDGRDVKDEFVNDSRDERLPNGGGSAGDVRGGA